ncbi:MAG: hypothetical protein IBX55_13965 [Methyloprofundus sp.]|nr:hypothetical protein [Methyloprofundus sp.]
MRTALWNYASRITGIPAERVLWLNFNQPAPPRPYATIQIINSTTNNAAHTPPDREGMALMHADTLITLRIQVYDDSTPFAAFDAVNLAGQRAKLITEQQLLRADGLALVDVLAVNDAPALVGTEWESRGIIDLQLRTLTTLVDEAGLIERVEIEGDVQGINVNVQTEV